MAANPDRAALIAAAFVIWSSWGVFIRDLGMNAGAITFYVAAIACAASLALRFVLARSRGEPFSKEFLPPPQAKALFIIGSVFAANNVTFFWSMQLTTIA